MLSNSGRPAACGTRRPILRLDTRGGMLGGGGGHVSRLVRGLVARFGVSFGTCLIVSVGPLAAQGGPPTAAPIPSGSATGVSALALGSADPSADTGRMVAAHTSWAADQTAGMCVAAMHTVQFRLTRPLNARKISGNASNIAVALPAGGRLPMPLSLAPEALATGRACAQGLRLATAPATTLPDFFLLALMLHDDTLAQAVLHQELLLAPDAHERATLLASAFQAALATVPARPELATVVLRHLDTVSDAWLEQFYVRQTLMRVATTPAAKAAYLDTLVALSAHFTPAALTQWQLALDVFAVYRAYLPQLRARVPADAAAATTYRQVRERDLALIAQLKTLAPIYFQGGYNIAKALNEVPPPL